jgi:hypothetical protein
MSKSNIKVGGKTLTGPKNRKLPVVLNAQRSFLNMKEIEEHNKETAEEAALETKRDEENAAALGGRRKRTKRKSKKARKSRRKKTKKRSRK